ncbi:MAG TPA: MBL fold metallo-hydrolase [Phenylobacterium sp.]|uniref:MBL fold metallo-hydrolase n=1 Tax=Phenylobacterium sp. TaxID=1871053 RepID=UPI002B4736E9|nr:MBL fold metallo-hydrolase [Phenylobacterium sp.]HKR88417.1 MBL fold metallo-hydrolase [Phenylobacterium sp.]
MLQKIVGAPAKPKARNTDVPLSRREAFAGLATVGLGISLAGGPAASQTPAMAQAFPLPPNIATEIRAELQPLAPNVWAFIQREAPNQSNLSVSNCGLIAGPRGLLAIDSTSAPVQAKRFRALAEKATGKTFERVVITHGHPDHTWGLQFLGDGLQIIAQEECAAMMARSSTARPGLWNPRNPAWSDGSENYKLILPDITYTEKMTLFGYGPKQVQLLWPGRAHTLGDTNVYLPEEKVIFVGDIGFFGVTPLNGSGYVANWIRVCDQINEMDVTAIVPGHGPVGGKAELEDMKQYLVLLWNQSKKAFDRGVTPGRAAAEIDLGKYASWKDADRVLPNVTRLYAEHAGTIAAAISPTAMVEARTEFERIKRGR